jgi:hypothetical protein
MADRDLTPGGFGEEIAALHRQLSALGIAVPDSEVERRFFGPGTQQAVREFQRRNRLPVTGTVDEATAAALDAADRARPREAAAGQPASRSTRSTMQPSSLAWSASRLVDSYVRFGEELWGRSWNIAAESLQRAVREVEGSAVRPRRPQHLLGNLLAEYANYVSGMAMVLPLAAENAAERIDGRRRRIPDDEDGVRDGTAPRTLSRMIDWPGSGAGAPSTSLALPVRFIDASQGWAVYVVPFAVATRVLGSSTDFLNPFELGGRRTLLAVLGTDYRASDLGRCREIALALAVALRNAPTGVPGAVFLGIGVSGEFACDTGRVIWGLRKVFNKDLSVAYRPNRAAFGLGSDHPESLSIGFPRFGRRRSEGIPVSIYSRQDGGGGHNATPLRSVLTLSGRGQGVQVGGSVSIRLGSGDRAHCVCRGLPEDCLCRTLEEFEVKDRLPAANGWTEHLSGILDEPQAVRLSH